MTSLIESEEETLLRDAAAGFLNDASPVAALRQLRDAGQPYDPALWQQMVAMGWVGVLIPEAQGGADMGCRAAAILGEEMGARLTASPFLSTAVIAATVLRHGGAASRLSQIAAGQLTYALALEESSKHAPDAVALRAEPVGNGYRLSGSKRFVADAGFADRLLLLVRSDGAPGQAAGLTLFDFELTRAGITVEETPTVDSRNHAAVHFDAVALTGDDILGELGAGMSALQPGLLAGQAVLAAELTGLARGASSLTLSYLGERQQFGRPIGSFQALQHRAAHLYTELEITQSAVIHAGRLLDQQPEAAEFAVSLAKARAIATAKLCVSEALQMHGGIGMTDEHDIGLFMKRARVGAEYLGDYGYHAARVARARGL